MTDDRPTPALRRYRPEPWRWWVAQTPAGWPGPEGPWTHLADRALGTAGSGAVPALDPGAMDDVLYLPPVAAAAEAQRSALSDEMRAAGVPVLAQCLAGGAGSPDEVLDLAAILLSEGVGGLDGLSTHCSSAVWPLIPGLTDNAQDWAPGLERLAAAGVETVVPVAVSMSPAQRRALAELTDDDGYQALFHGRSPDERAFACAAAALGLRSLPPRPALASTPRREFARRAATELIVIAELWMRLGRGEPGGQELLRAARWIAASDHDLRALAREGNLGVLPWLNPEARQVVEDLTHKRPSALREALESEYTGAVP